MNRDSNHQQLKTIIFDGEKLAAQRTQQLAVKLQPWLAKGVKPVVAAIVFTEDAGSRLYTDLKAQKAAEVGIEYRRYFFSLRADIAQVQAQIQALNADPQVTGIIIQKPWRKTWLAAVNGEAQTFSAQSVAAQYQNWWQQLVGTLVVSKDVDGLHPETAAALRSGTWTAQKYVFPATMKAVLTILGIALPQLKNKWTGESELNRDLSSATARLAIIGRSDLLGQPLYWWLKNQNFAVKLLGQKEFNDPIEQKYLQTVDVIVTATGIPKLLTGNLIKQGSVVIDVGEPQADVDRSVLGKASFLTPVPGGVGPLTVISLLENCWQLLINQGLVKE